MSIIPQNTDPLKDYVTQNIQPPMTLNGLVYNKVYAHTGVVDSLGNTQQTGYSDPNLGITNNSNNISTFEQVLQTSWISDTDFGGPNSNPVVLKYVLSNKITYYNTVQLAVLNVPCFVELLDQNGSALPGTSTFMIVGGSDINTTDDWVSLNYTAPSTLTAAASGSTQASISLRITRNQAVQTYQNQSLPVNTPYSIGVTDFRFGLSVMQESDIPLPVINNTTPLNGIITNPSGLITTQNFFGFVENYQFTNNSVSNIFNNDTAYWKCSPQPVKDSIVYFYAKISDPSPTAINRIYVDPIYSGCKFNVYYTTNSVSGGIDPSQFYWAPIQRDFTLRKGIYEIPTTSCTYLKFEFTKLVPEVYDLPVDSIARTVNIFPPDVEQYYYDLEQSIIDGNNVNYSYTVGNNPTTQTQNSNQLSSSTVFGAATNTVANNNSWPSLAALNTSQLGASTTVGNNTSSTVIDPTKSYKLIDSNGQYNFQSYSEFLDRRFYDTRIHNYNQVTIDQSWHQSYFVGVRYLTTFYEVVYDDMRGTPQNLLSRNGSNTGFASQDINYVYMNTNDTATTPWIQTIDSFSSFNVAGLTTDWKSFLTQNNSINNDITLMNYTNPSVINKNSIVSIVSNFGNDAQIVQVVQNQPGIYGVETPQYNASTNLLSYYDANFTSVSGNTNKDWFGLGSTTVTGTSVSWVNGTTGGTASGLSVSGGSYSVAYNFTIPNVYSTMGTTPWTLALGTPSLGTVGYASYNPTGTGINYYFLATLQASTTTTGTLYTQFINPTTSGVISGTLVSGNTITVTGGVTNVMTVTGTNYVGSTPSNTIQVVISGSSGTPFNIYQAGAFASPTSSWVTTADRSNMRISGVARMFLPQTNQGNYQINLVAYSTSIKSNGVILASKSYLPGAMPVNTWFDVELETFTGSNYQWFSVQVLQLNGIAEPFYLSMLAPFYHPIRYEYRNTINGTWYPITTGINDPEVLISTASGIPANGIQLRMTSLDPGTFISGVSLVPNYKQNPYYSNLQIDYLGGSKTNEVESRTAIENKPYFQLNTEVHPAIFDINRIAGTIIPYSID